MSHRVVALVAGLSALASFSMLGEQATTPTPQPSTRATPSGQTTDTSRSSMPAYRRTPKAGTGAPKGATPKGPVSPAPARTPTSR